VGVGAKRSPFESMVRYIPCSAAQVSKHGETDASEYHGEDAEGDEDVLVVPLQPEGHTGHNNAKDRGDKQEKNAQFGDGSDVETDHSREERPE